MQQTNEQLLVRPQSPVLRALRAAAPQTLPVLAGYFVLGMGYGIYVQSLGLPVWMPMLMGTVVYGGSLEFVLASLLLGAFSPLSAFLMALMIQARHLFYGLAMLERYKGYGLRSFYMIFAMSDETFSITCSAEPPEVVRYLGRVLPAAIFGMLIVYCLKSVTPFAGSRGAPEAIALLVTVALHKWKHETLLSVAGGTLCYVLLVQLVF